MIWTTRPRSDCAGLQAITAGDGPLVVLIHGVGLRAEAWAAQIDALARSHRVVAPDLPGHGSSPLPGPGADLGAYGDRVAAAIAACASGGPALLVGHSLGAMIALDLAIRFPHLSAGVAALNAVYRRRDAATAAVRARAAMLDGVAVPDPAPTLDRWFADDPSPERAACEAWLRAVDPVGYKMAYGVFAAQDGPSEAGLRALHGPALFMTGDTEPNSLPAMSRAMAAIAPQGRAEICAGAAHMMPMTHPAAVNAALRALATEVFA